MEQAHFKHLRAEHVTAVRVMLSDGQVNTAIISEQRGPRRGTRTLDSAIVYSEGIPL